MFENYKKRNLRSIALYKILISNYEKMKCIKNYNIENNIFINDNFDLSDSKYYLKYYYEDNDNECLSASFNKLYNFYLNKNYVVGNKLYTFFMSKRLCNRKIKKIIMFNKECFVISFEKGDMLNFLTKNEKGEYQLIERSVGNNNEIKDIYEYNNDTSIIISKDNQVTRLRKNDDKKDFFMDWGKFGIGEFVVRDLLNKNNFFIIRNDSEYYSIIYYKGKNNDKECEYNIIHTEQKKVFSVEILFEYINSLIDNCKYMDKKNIKYLLNHEMKGSEYEQLLQLDNNLLMILDNEAIDIYNEFKDIIEINKNKDKDNAIINTNYIINQLKLLPKKENKQEEKKVYILELYKLINTIRERYMNFLAVNSKINNVYNLNNNFLLFTCEKYLFIEYELKTKKFKSSITSNFIPNDNKNYIDFEIKCIYSNIIIINNELKKIFYIIEKEDDIYLIKDKYKYLSNIFEYNNYLLFDVINENNFEFKMIDLSKKIFVENAILKDIFNFKITLNIPKIISFNNSNKFVLLYENNQICIIDCNFIKNDEYDNFVIIDEKNKDDITQENKELTKNENNIWKLYFKDIEEINVKENGTIVPIVMDNSKVYSYYYNPSYLFDNYNYSYYYCSYDNKEQFFKLDFSKEYNFNEFRIKYDKAQKENTPKKYNLELYDNDYKKINVFEFCTSNNEIKEEIKCLGFKARYIHFILKENFGGNYFVIKKIEFHCVDDVI